MRGKVDEKYVGECTPDVDGYEPACCTCPALATCEEGATIETIALKKNAWRNGFESPQVLECDNEYACAEPRWLGVNGTNSSGFCNKGYESALCRYSLHMLPDKLFRFLTSGVAIANQPQIRT